MSGNAGSHSFKECLINHDLYCLIGHVNRGFNILQKIDLDSEVHWERGSNYPIVHALHFALENSNSLIIHRTSFSTMSASEKERYNDFSTKKILFGRIYHYFEKKMSEITPSTHAEHELLNSAWQTLHAQNEQAIEEYDAIRREYGDLDGTIPMSGEPTSVNYIVPKPFIQELAHAIFKKNTREITTLIDSELLDINTPLSNRNTVLSISILKKDTDVFNLLLEHGADCATPVVFGVGNELISPIIYVLHRAYHADSKADRYLYREMFEKMRTRVISQRHNIHPELYDHIKDALHRINTEFENAHKPAYRAAKKSTKSKSGGKRRHLKSKKMCKQTQKNTTKYRK